jgi:hypothetical protein
MDRFNLFQPPLFTRRQIIWSFAAFAAGAFIQPAVTLCANPIKNAVRFAVIGDWGTGDSDTDDIARQMLKTHWRSSPLDFILTPGYNIYPDGSGRHFAN